ncbi:serine hydrolase [Algibacter amylolyticus]|uniref:Serine hydrolase n=1 Tax=Algibacter amylolyticus TaxID=1608400 RepID=A0A5M7B829_9FLAO|nr:serine hydrolase [Algibacter amylolyticus]KAA5824458.1 serine hydrolase [Algibacter amylolyticus]MBB5269483.1 CubicO group peptidase (beta-lactamase class C family) [Algibacter amylolyticus]TSJ75231.1 serine hydrolase [Algibacter amylolyticus]
MKSILYYSIVFLLLFNSCSNTSEDNAKEEELTPDTMYFPENTSDYWESTTIAELNWNTNNLQPLLDFLEEKNTKSFMILYNGKIVLEEYMNDHNNSKSWYWASAGKTLTTTLTGIAQNEGLLNIEHMVSDYLGTGWTSATIEQENLITCKHLLSMNSGLDDSLGDDVSSENLQYLADAGSHWSYHNVYVKLQDVIASASNQDWSDYFNSKLRDKIGMTGQWINLGDLSVYWSNTRSMARFGLLIAAQGTWEDSQIIPQEFLTDATNTSQNINKAYGYMWWLNGKDSYHLPESQIEFNGKLIPNAPDDMFAALGKNDQKIYIVPSKNLVVIRMGEAADEDNFALSTFDNDLWGKINALIN